MRIVRTCASTVFSVSHSRRAMPPFVRPSAISESTSRSRGESSSSALTGLGAPISVATTCGSSAEPPSDDAPRGVEEVVDVEHAVLEQVAEAAAGGRPARRCGASRCAGRGPARRSRVRSADLGRGARALVVVVGRHADVDDGEVGRVLADEREQRVGVAGPADDLVPGVLEQPGEALRAAARCPRRSRRARQLHRDPRSRAGRAVDGQRPALRGDPVEHPRQPASRPTAPRRRRRRRRPAGAARRRRARPRRTRVGDACLTALVSASQATKYAAASTSGGARSALASTSTGTPAPRARSVSAAASPSSSRGGRTPAAIVRRSAIAPPPRRPRRRARGRASAPRAAASAAAAAARSRA